MNLAGLNAAEQTRAHTNEPLAGPSSTFDAVPPCHEHRRSSPGRGLRVLRRRDWQMNLKPLIKPGPKLTWLHLVGFSRPLWTECLIVEITSFGAGITLFLKVFGLLHNLMALGRRKKQLNDRVTAYLEEEMKMMKSYNYRFNPTSVFS